MNEERDSLPLPWQGFARDGITFESRCANRVPLTVPEIGLQSSPRALGICFWREPPSPSRSTMNNRDSPNRDAFVCAAIRNAVTI
jgi:hypothetical protein